MFYSQFILAKKGPLATIWIAAHLERKLRKNQIAETNISDSVDSILYPEVPIALRLSGHLLLGVVRIYSRKVNLLFSDCSEALVKIHQAFQSSAVNLPPGAVVAPFNSITLPESFDFDEFDVRLPREHGNARTESRSEFEHHVTARDLITLQEQNDDRRILFTLDERFEDAGNPYAVLDLAIEELSPQKLDSPPPVQAEKMPTEDDVLPPLPMEDMEFEHMDLDKEMPVELEPQKEIMREAPPSPFPETTLEVPEIEKLRAANIAAGEQDRLMGLEDLDVHREASVSLDVEEGLLSSKKGGDQEGVQTLEETPIMRVETTPIRPQRSSSTRRSAHDYEDQDVLGSILGKRTPNLDVIPTPVSVKQGRKKRKQAFDAAVSLSSAEMKKQLKSTNDVCRARQKAPSTEYEIWMSNRDNHVEQIFKEPSFPGLCDDLKKKFDDVLTKRLISSRKRPRNDQLSPRNMPKAAGRSDSDANEMVDDVRTWTDGDLGVEDALETAIDLGASSKASDRSEKAEGSSKAQPLSAEHAVMADPTAQRGEPLSPEPELPLEPVPAADDEVALEVAREGDEAAMSVEPVKSRDSGREDAAVVSTDDAGSLGAEASKSQGLSFLAESRDTDEPSIEIGGKKQTGKSASNDNGWSSRSRAVAQYLKEKFEGMETASTMDRTLNLGSLLDGRTRKEAARMFFETLVLGTKGYLQVEQEGPYADVLLLPNQRLLKAVF